MKYLIFDTAIAMASFCSFKLVDITQNYLGYQFGFMSTVSKVVSGVVYAFLGFIIMDEMFLLYKTERKVTKIEAQQVIEEIEHEIETKNAGRFIVTDESQKSK
jgi:hypothetical protein